MRFALALFCLVWLLASTATVSAQEEGDTTAEPDSDPGASKTSDSTASQQEERAYAAAFSLMSEGRWHAARLAFEEYLDEFPSSDRRELAAELLRLATALDDAAEPVTVMGPDRSGRVELLVYSTTFGIWTGVALSVLGDLGTSSILVTFATASVGLTTAILLTRRGEITQGQTASIETGGSWGTWNGAAISLATDPDSEKTVIGWTLASGLGGLGLGIAVGALWRPAAGDVAVANSFGIWSTFLTGMALLASKADLDGQQVLTTLVIGGDVGLVGGAVAAGNWLDISRGRANLIDLGGVLGLLLAGGILAIDGTTSRPLIASTLTGGAIVGLGAAAWATDGWDPQREEPEMLLQLGPLQIDGPAPTVLASPAIGDDRVYYGARVLGGRF